MIRPISARFKTIIPLFAFLVSFSCTEVKKTVQAPVAENRRPLLIVGITVDQMRFDYLEKYWDDYSDVGFKRLLSEGFTCRNMHYNYMPTYTGPGHASIFTGTTPAYHGIIQNDWYDRRTGKMMYCSGDSLAEGVGTKSAAGKMSPRNMFASTLGDELKLFSNERSKVIGISMKDRGAILPAGRMANAAYWFVGGEEGVWASSNWYHQNLPDWVNEYNKNGKALKWSESTWSLMRDEAVYDESMDDNNAHETPFKGTLRPVFPYDLKELKAANGNMDILKATPFGNSLTVDFAMAAIQKEQLGKDKHTDMLCMSFSATDYVGHQFGIHARETQDSYLRLDYDIANFLNFLDNEIGAGNYLVFLSADHGGAPTPSYTTKHNGTGGYWKSDLLEEELQASLTKKYGAGQWIINESNNNIFLNRELIASRNLSLNALQTEVAEIARKNEAVLMAFEGYSLQNGSQKIPLADMVEMGYNHYLSGDVIYVLKPGYMEYSLTGTTHGSPYVYDTHVPAIFYGFGVKKGETHHRYNITDIAPTISSICKIPFPNACSGTPIIEAIR